MNKQNPPGILINWVNFGFCGKKSHICLFATEKQIRVIGLIDGWLLCQLLLRLCAGCF